jgi:SAM-dependent methyltransferase
LDPVAAYDLIAPHFAALAEQRRAYLDGVDRLVIASIPPGSRRLLDCGAGDGVRSRCIAQSCQIPELVLLEPSVQMQGKDRGAAEILTLRAEDLHQVAGAFDVITCLWNVLGHVSPAAGRAEVLRQFARLLSPGGKVFIDVNHRYNFRHYGVVPTAMRFVHDLLSSDERNGDVAVTWSLGEAECMTSGHVFMHREIVRMCDSAGLRIEKRFVLDYATGQERSRSFEGNLLYVLGR